MNVLLIILGIVCALICLLTIANMILKEEKLLKGVIESRNRLIDLRKKSKTVSIPGTEGGHQRVEIDEPSGYDLFTFEMERAGTSARTQAVFNDLKIYSPGQLTNLTKSKLSAIKGCGPVTIKEIVDIASMFDIKIKE